jgi:hypothetical protein
MSPNHWFFIIVGYFLSALTVAALYFWLLFPVELIGRIDIAGMILLSPILFSLGALPVAGPFIYFAERKDIRRASAFAGAGVLASLVGTILMISLLGWEDGRFTKEFFPLAPIGAIGGLVYWAVAGRKSGVWKTL